MPFLFFEVDMTFLTLNPLDWGMLTLAALVMARPLYRLTRLLLAKRTAPHR
jgi:hypothetical protein